MQRGGRDSGASAIELSIVAPALLLLIFAAVQIGLWLYGRNVADQAAREGVSYLRTVIGTATPGSALSAAEVTASNFALAVGQGTIQDVSADADVLDGTRVRMRVRGRAISLVPGMTLEVHASAEGEIELFQVDR